MLLDLIETVEFHKLRDDTYDRRGPVCTFTVKDIPNHEMAVWAAAELVHHILAMLHGHYNPLSSNDVGRLSLGERNECWVEQSHEKLRAVVVRHKYWGVKTIEAFRDILRRLMKLHGWNEVATHTHPCRACGKDYDLQCVKPFICKQKGAYKCDACRKEELADEESM